MLLITVGVIISLILLVAFLYNPKPVAWGAEKLYANPELVKNQKEEKSVFVPYVPLEQLRVEEAHKFNLPKL